MSCCWGKKEEEYPEEIEEDDKIEEDEGDHGR